MTKNGWEQLLEGELWLSPDGHYPIPAYSEFMPGPKVGCTPFGSRDASLFHDDDPFGWYVSELEEEYELRPGLEEIAHQVLDHLVKLGQSKPASFIAGHGGRNLRDNPYWPPELAAHAGHLPNERYLVLLPLALSRTQDDMGRVRWTFFGGSEQGPERAFWSGFSSAPGQEWPEDQALAFFSRVLADAYDVRAIGPNDLKQAGFRILPSRKNTHLPDWTVDPLPSWTKPFLIQEQDQAESVRYLLTFRPFADLPNTIQDRYFAGRLALWPFPGSLVFWGMPTFLRLAQDLPLGIQIPLMRLVAPHGGPTGLRVPQSGWLHIPCPGVKPPEMEQELLVENYRRTHRWNRVHRYDDELAQNARLDKVTRVLFSTELKDLELYNKPMARNAQLWTKDFELVLDGTNAAHREIDQAEAKLARGGLFGYRFHFPPMRVGRHEVYWHRALVAFMPPNSGQARLILDAPLGYLTAYSAGASDLASPIELWPRVLRRENYVSALRDFAHAHDYYSHQTALNIVALLDAWHTGAEQPLARSLAQDLLRVSKTETIEEWLDSLPDRATPREKGEHLRSELVKLLAPPAPASILPEPLTYAQTATRSFEEGLWQDMSTLAEGRFVNKDNADIVLDPTTQKMLVHHERDLERLGDYLLDRHNKAIAAAGMEGKALCGDMPFRWQTEFNFASFGGWVANQQGPERERDLLVVIPGRDRSQAVIMADHYDTAYMEDVFDPSRGGSGARLSAPGADDNYSATATLLQAAPLFLELARMGKLARDIWLIHLTGEEFPSDCMGARHLCQALVEKSLKLRLNHDSFVDLPAQVVGVVVMDMIAHNRDNAQDIFQVSPGKSRRSLEMARQAHLATEIWNSRTHEWNKNPERRVKGRGQRSADGKTIPEIAAHLQLHGEIRTADDPQSSLYNTDGQIFSDIGAPVVLFMENYDINRTGYHDTKDTMLNIDLDYGAALSAIAIETVARLAAS